MKNKWLLAGFIAALILTAVLLSRMSDNVRDTGNVEIDLQGHWLAENSDELYYGPNMVIAMTPEGTKSYHPYRVLMCNERESWMKIFIANNSGHELERVIHFNKNRNAYQTTAIVFMNGTRTERSSTVTYVDEKQQP